MTEPIDFYLVSEIPEGMQPILPKRATSRSAGYDFYSPCNIDIEPGQKVKIKTFIKCAMDPDMVLMIYPRSSMANKGITLVNTVGIIDADYCDNSDNEGNIIVMLQNNTDEVFHINQGDRIVQGIIQNYYVTNNDTVERIRKGGIGSTDIFNKKG